MKSSSPMKFTGRPANVEATLFFKLSTELNSRNSRNDIDTVGRISKLHEPVRLHESP